ncbi:MAG TPA: ROK family protein [Prolixibacteraceae bacterium]|nr:ROK family protein [Prolixibacteraceae bacterium]
MNKIAIGVDIGGSHISCAAVDLTNETLLKGTLTEADVDKNGSAEEIFLGWAKALQNCVSKTGNAELVGFGFGLPGPFEYHKGIGRYVNNDKFYSLNGVNVIDGLSEKLQSQLPLRFMNDASAFAIGEAWQGSAKGFDNSVSITLGTGFGSAFIRDGIPIVDGNTVPEGGCTWHLPYKEGIADDYFSTRWFIKRYHQLTGKTISGGKQLEELVKDGDPIAKSVYEEYGGNMGEFFSPWLKKFGAKVLVIGGNIALGYSLFGPSFEDKLKTNRVETAIKLSKLKENAAIIGSAKMLDPKFWEKIQAVLPKM